MSSGVDKTEALLGAESPAPVSLTVTFFVPLSVEAVLLERELSMCLRFSSKPLKIAFEF